MRPSTKIPNKKKFYHTRPKIDKKNMSVTNKKINLIKKYKFEDKSRKIRKKDLIK